LHKLIRLLFYYLLFQSAFSPVLAIEEGSQTTNKSDLKFAGFLEEWSKNHLPKGITLYAKNWLRWSEWRYFDPAAPGGDPDYGFFSNRLRFGLNAKKETWGAEVSFQYVKQWSLPDDASGTTGGELGLGAVYFEHNGSTAPDSLYIKYFNLTLLNIADTGLNATVGRFNYSGGLETLSGVPKIDWLKKVRLDARLIGEFDWSIYQRSFDGIKLQWDHELGHLSVSGFRPTQGGFERSANKHISDIDILATAYTFKPGKLIPNSEIQFFDYYYDDERDIPVRADNSGLAPPSHQDLSFHTIGGHFAGAKQIGPGTADLLLWGAYQTGDWFEQDHRASGVAVEAGYQFTDIRWKPWIRTGAYHGSGDDDPADGTHGTFYQILPTVRKYAFTTAYNLMNNKDYFIQLLLSPHKKLKLRTDLHFLELNESADLWYSGAGATQAEGTIQGYDGRPSGGDDDLGTSLEFTAQYQLTNDINLHAFYGHVFGGEVISNNFTDDEDFDFFFMEVTLDF